MSTLFTPVSTPDPQEIGLLLLPEFSNLTLAAVMEPLRVANRLAGRPLYRWWLLSPDGAPVTSCSDLAFAVESSLADAGALKSLFVIASYNWERYATPPLLARLRALRTRGCQFGGFESGSNVLARAGLLDGHRATTHWWDLEDFADRFPAVEVLPDRFVIDRGRFTSGGATPALDLVLHLIRAQHGYSLALDVASTFTYEQERSSADPQRLVALGRLRWRHPALAAAIGLMETHLEEPLSIAEIARRAGLGQRALERLFARILGTRPLAYYLDLRLQAARRLLLQGRQGVAEIAVACGFSSASTFARAFRRRFGTSPGRLRAQG